MTKALSWMALATVVGLSLGVAHQAVAQDSAQTLKLKIDTRVGNRKAPAAAVQPFAQLRNHALVCLELKVVVDGKKPNAVLTSNEGDNRRYPIDCRPGQLGSFPMVDGVEYYFPAMGKVNGKDLDIAIYPGTRTRHPFNDADCVLDPKNPKAALFRISGFYTVRTHNYGRRVVELRPAPLGEGVTRKAAAACLD